MLAVLALLRHNKYRPPAWKRTARCLSALANYPQIADGIIGRPGRNASGAVKSNNAPWLCERGHMRGAYSQRGCHMSHSRVQCVDQTSVLTARLVDTRATAIRVK